MNFQVSRNGQMYGPYTLADLQRYVGSGNVLLTDLAKSEAMSEWLPVSQVLAREAPGFLAGAGAASPAAGAASPAYAPVSSADTPYQMPYGAAGALVDPPNLSWGLVILFSILTCGLFSLIWDLVQAAWMRRVQPGANALFFYIAAIVSEFINVALSVRGGGFVMSRGMGAYSGHFGNPIASLFGLLYFILLIVGRFSFRSSLEDFYNRVDPIGLRLGPVMTFFFGGIYFQYHFNKINAIKQALRYRGQAI